MIVVDANILLYAYNSTCEQHKLARQWLEDAFSGAEQIRLPWLTILAFIRISTNTRVFKYPLVIHEAVEIVSDWMQRPGVGILDPGERHWDILSKLLPKSQASGPLVMDAYLAALAMEHGAVLCTSDRDFSRFPGLRILNPLE